MRIRNAFGTSFVGALGKDMVASSWKGHDYIKAYRVSANPRTERQQEHRARFAAAVEAWHALSLVQQRFYRRLADGMTGYNLFIGRHIQAERSEKVPEVPIRLRYATPDGSPVPDAALRVLRGKVVLFDDNLGDGKGEIALTPSDAPYTFALRRRARQEIVATAWDLPEEGAPRVLESAALGIRLELSADEPGALAETPAGPHL